MDVGGWLRSLGLGQYEALFRASEIDADILPELTDADLKELGVPLGHRKRLLRATSGLTAPEAFAAPSASTGPKPQDAAERRQLTVMFCDLVGSTALSARFDPEELRQEIRAYQNAVAGVVARYDGFVAKYMGDGVLAYFGYPRAHEDDAERAVRAGLEIAAAVASLETRGTEPLAVRIGIATGLVVVGDLVGEGSAQEQAVVGETPNLAARLQSMAEPNTVVIGAGTRRLIGDLFEYRDLGAVEVKGIAAPVPAWQVLRPSAVASRFEALRGSALTPLVGRDEEIDLLLRRWARAKAGDGQVVLICGEPGIGKSRLTAALTVRLHAEPHIRLRHFCSPYHQDSALFPFIDQLGRASGFARDDPPVAKLGKLEALLSGDAPVEEDVALIADLLSLPASERHPLPNLSPQRKKDRTLEALLRQLEGQARQRPVVMVFEDAHWIDPTSRELLDLTVERMRTLPILLIVTFRPEFQPPWTGQPQVTMLALNRLDRRDRTSLVTQIAGGKALPDDIIAQIAERTDGVPLFVEELTKSVLESGVPLVGIPTTLHDSLMARLDRLASVRIVAQIGAAIGREFSYELVHAVSRLPQDELQSALGRLVASELVFQRGTPPDAMYSFKHALVQNAAHGSLLRSSRQQLHAQIAEALESHSPELMDSQPELFAQHYAEAGLVEKSVAFWGQAGRKSAGRSAMAEAAAQLQKGLDQLALLPDDRERQRRELELRRTLGAALMTAKGLAAAETGHALARSRELWEQLGSPADFLGVPYGQSTYHALRGELDRALGLAEDLLRLSRRHRDSAGLLLGHSSAGRTLMFAGRFGPSRSHLEEALALYDPISHHALVNHVGFHAHINSKGYLGNALSCLGFLDQAFAHISTAIAEARRLAHPPSLAGSLTQGAVLLSFNVNDAILGEWADELCAVAREQGFPHLAAQGATYRGSVLVRNGNLAEGLSLLREGSTAFSATGAKVFVPYHMALLAKACEIAGQIDEAVRKLNDALQMVEQTGERWLLAELYRHKGQLLLRQGQSEIAEESYRKALSVAEEQGAKLWELRTAMSLARLQRYQDRRAEARDRLAAVYYWFTEGFETTDLKEAKALLDELA
jgi:class 3 adenylate cyclase/predicted ATPase